MLDGYGVLEESRAGKSLISKIFSNSFISTWISGIATFEWSFSNFFGKRFEWSPFLSWKMNQ